MIDADLGGNVYKKRVALHGRGKRGGARTILAYKTAEKVFFIFGFAKNEKSTIEYEDLKIAKCLTKELLGYSDQILDKLVQQRVLIEVVTHE